MKISVFIFLLISAMAFSYLVYWRAPENQLGEMTDPKAKEGKLIWQSYNCQACHQLYGLGGYMGPDLTNVISAPGKGRDYAYALLSTGTAKMPNFHLSELQKEQLIAFLTDVSQSGEYPLKTGDIDLRWGSFLIKKIKKH